MEQPMEQPGGPGDEEFPDGGAGGGGDTAREQHGVPDEDPAGASRGDEPSVESEEVSDPGGASRHDQPAEGGREEAEGV